MDNQPKSIASSANNPSDEVEDHDILKDCGLFPNIAGTASACECTGMMYSPPKNEDEYEAYQALFSMQIPKKKDIKSAKS